MSFDVILKLLVVKTAKVFANETLINRSGLWGKARKTFSKIICELCVNIVRNESVSTLLSLIVASCQQLNEHVKVKFS